MLPWGPHKGPVMAPPDADMRPGEFVMRLLFTEFTVQAERKMEVVMAEPLVSSLLDTIESALYGTNKHIIVLLHNTISKR